MADAERVGKSRIVGTRKYPVHNPQLSHPRESLEYPGLNDVYLGLRQSDRPANRISYLLYVVSQDLFIYLSKFLCDVKKDQPCWTGPIKQAEQAFF